MEFGRGTGPISGAQDARAGPADPPVRDHDPPWGNPTLHGVTSRRASPLGRSSPTPWAQSLAQLPGEVGGLGHTSENGPGATVREVTEVSIGYPADGVVRPVLKDLPSLNLGR